MRAKIIFLSLVLVAALIGCRKSQPESVLLVTVDSLRYDELNGLNMQKLKSRGVNFKMAFTPSPVTIPAVAAIMTGKHPLSHGMLWDYDYTLSGEEVTLAEAFQVNSLRTAAEIGSSVLDPTSGIQQGFDAYGYNFDSVKLGLLPQVTVRPAEDVLKDVSGWMEAFGDKPFFIWAHFADLNIEEAGRQQALVDIDAALGKLIDMLPDHGSRTMIILAATTGISMGAHDEYGHGTFLYDDTVHVPLVMAGPGIVPAETDAPVSLEDIMPTVLSFMGFQLPKEVQGKDLSYLLRGGKMTGLKPEWVLVTRETYNLWGWAPLSALRTDSWKYIRAPRPELYDIKSDPGETKNMVQEKPEIVGQMEARLKALEEEYSSKAVAQENKNLVPPAGAKLTDPKDGIKALPAIFTAVALIEGKNYEEALKQLQIAESMDPDNKQTPFLMAQAYGGLGQNDKALPLLETAAERNPGDAVVQATLGEAYMTAGQYDKAAASFEMALAIQPTMLPAYQNLGFLYQRFAQGLKGDDRMESLEKALYYLMMAHRKLDDDSPKTLYNIGAVSLEMGQELRSRENSGNQNENPEEPRFKSSDMLSNAVKAFTLALNADPEMAEAHFMLGQVLAYDPQKKKEAREHLEKFLELAPDDPNVKTAKTLLKMLGE